MLIGPDASLASRLVAHRGWPARYPENSLIGIQAALDAGARWIELDIQLTLDGVPVAVHDRDLKRVAGHGAVICDTSWVDLGGYDIGQGRRFGKRFMGTRVSRLYDILECVARSEAYAFVEAKCESIARFGAEEVMAYLLPVLDSLPERSILIAFDHLALAQARHMGARRIGWVLPAYDEQHRRIAEDLAPDYLFCSRRKLPHRGTSLWPGPWQWAVYVVDSIKAARDWINRGVDLVETDRIGKMLAAARALATRPAARSLRRR